LPYFPNFLLIFIKSGTGTVHTHLLDAVTFMKLGKVDSDKNHIALVNINQSYEEKKIDLRKGERPDDSQEDSDFQRNSKLEHQSAVDPASIVN